MRALFLCAAVGVASALGPAVGKHYRPHEPLTAIANKVGPFNNPSETYQYFSLPFCRSAGKSKKHHDFGESLVGDRKVCASARGAGAPRPRPKRAARV